MADSSRGIFRQIRLLFDRDSAKKVEGQLADSLTAAGKKGGESFLTELRKAFAARMADLRTQMARGIIDKATFTKLGNEAAKDFNTGLLKGMDQARAAGTLTESVSLKLSKQFKSTGDEGETAFGRIKSSVIAATAALGAFVGLRALERFGSDSIKQAAESEKIWNELGGTIEAAGGSWKSLEKNVRAAGDAFQNTTVHSDEDYAKGLQRLIILTGDTSASLNNMGIAANVAARFTGGDLMAAVELVAKGMSSGLVPIAKGVKITLQELADRSFGGASEAAKTFTGRMKQLSNGWEEFKEQLGNALIGTKSTAGALDVLVTGVKELTGWVTANRDELRAWATTGVETAMAAFRTFIGLVKDFAQYRGALSFTVGTAAFIPGDTEDKLNRQLVNLRKTRGDIEAEALGTELALKKTQRFANILPGAAGALAGWISGLRQDQDVKSIKSQLDLVNKNIATAEAALADLGKTAPGFTDPLSITKAALSKNVKEDPAEASQRKHFEELKADLELQVAGLQRVADATSQGKDATDLANQSLKDEEELRKSLKDLTPQQAAVIGPLVKQLQEQRRAVDDLAAAEQFRIDQEKLYADFRKENEAKLTQSIKDRQALEAAEGRVAATNAGTEALQAFDRQQAISNGLAERGLTLATQLGQRWAKVIGAQYDAQHQVNTGWKEAGKAVEEAGFAMFSSFADGGVKGIAEYAASAAKMFAAEALGALAHGFAALAFGPINGIKAAGYFKAAAIYGSAAAAFGAIGSGYSSGVNASGGAGTGGGPSGVGESAKPQGPDVTIILTGHLSALDPQIQEIIAGAQQETRQRYGENTLVRVVRGKAA